MQLRLFWLIEIKYSTLRFSEDAVMIFFTERWNIKRFSTSFLVVYYQEVNDIYPSEHAVDNRPQDGMPACP